MLMIREVKTELRHRGAEQIQECQSSGMTAPFPVK